MFEQTIYDELDAAINALVHDPLAQDEPSSDALGGLVQIADDLRDLPRREFKAELRAQMEERMALRTEAGKLGSTHANGALAANVLPTLFAGATELYPVKRGNFALSLAAHAGVLVLIATSG